MERIDFGKIVMIVILFFVGVFFFGDKVVNWYEHKDDMPFSLSQIVYTKEGFNSIEIAEQEAILSEVTRLCINKHHVDKLNCNDTAYWLAQNLEDEGVELDLAIEWMKPCSLACETGAFDQSQYIKENVPSQLPKRKTEGTKWIWEK